MLVEEITVEVEVVQEHYEQTGITKIRVEEHHQVLQNQSLLELLMQLVLVLVAPVKVETMVGVVLPALLMI